MSDERRLRRARPPVSYAEHGRERDPSGIVVEAVSHLGACNGRALDIGAGSLSSSRYLLAAGFDVDAVDPDPYTGERAAQLDDARLHVYRTDIRDMHIAPNNYSLAVAVHILHLLRRGDLDPVVRAVVDGLTERGILCVTFLGPRDAWAPTPWRATVLSRDELNALIAGLDVIRLEELEYDGTDVLGRPKRWHTYRCILRKSAESRTVLSPAAAHRKSPS